VLTYNGIERTRIEAINYGKYKPLNSNSNAAEQALNRKVCFKVNPKGCQLNVDSLITLEILSTFKSPISSQKVIEHDGSYMIETGVFKSEDTAIMMFVKLKDLLPDNIYIIKENGLYRVIVGYTSTRSEALDIARLIQASGVLLSN
jgi:hypothetical protein